MSVAQVLENALSHIRHYGWQQSAYGSKGGPCCLFGALYHANECSITSAAKFIEAALPSPPANYYSIIAYWNDANGRTKDEVEAKLDELIAKAKEQGL